MNPGDVYYRIPLDCMGGFISAWVEYRLPPGIVNFSNPPSVLDIGANCGGFMLYASLGLRAKYVTCYEPNPTLVPALTWNAERCACPVGLNFVAVGDPSLTRLYRHNNSPVSFSQYPTNCGSTTDEYLDIQAIHPAELKPHDVVKIDTEGAEAFICEKLTFTPELLFVEYHSNELRQRVDTVLSATMRLVEVTVNPQIQGIGVMKYVKNR